MSCWWVNFVAVQATLDVAMLLMLHVYRALQSKLISADFR